VNRRNGEHDKGGNWLDKIKEKNGVCITKVAVFFTQRHEGHEGFEITRHPWWSLCET